MHLKKAKAYRRQKKNIYVVILFNFLRHKMLINNELFLDIWGDIFFE